jgi:hypothetical protein
MPIGIDMNTKLLLSTALLIVSASSVAETVFVSLEKDNL